MPSLAETRKYQTGEITEVGRLGVGVGEGALLSQMKREEGSLVGEGDSV